MCALSLPPTSAQAAEVHVSGSNIRYTSVPGERTALTVTQAGGSFTFTDSASISVGAGCSGGPDTATCPDAGITHVTVLADDGGIERTNEVIVHSTTDFTLIGGPDADLTSWGTPATTR